MAIQSQGRVVPLLDRLRDGTLEVQMGHGSLGFAVGWSWQLAQLSSYSCNWRTWHEQVMEQMQIGMRRLPISLVKKQKHASKNCSAVVWAINYWHR